MFRLHRRPPAPDKIYSSSLESLHLGRALWYPEPHVTGEPQIGDVGYIREGAFVRLFNLDTSAPEKRVTFWETPFEAAEPLPPGVLKIDSRRRPLAPNHYCSHGVETKEMHASANVTTGIGVSVTLNAEYTCKGAQGAVLVLKSEAHSEMMFESRVLEQYIIRNHDSWYRYARDVLGHRVKREKLIMVSGWVKTEADWAATAFCNTSVKSGASLGGNVFGVAGAEMGGSSTSSLTGPKMHRNGEHYTTNTSIAPPMAAKRDQCVFLRCYKILWRLGVLPKVVAGAGYDQLPDPGDARGASAGEGVIARGEEDAHQPTRHQSEVSDPLDILLDYILEARLLPVSVRESSR
ncbi:uncharacterized protein PHACADRAFT_136010 [Phanerochaete carnosa HHB-10118-sp]|uniref:Uncharacterized protein n=1 Tax=Phanerochaete carnosa (strain HHB-10118-sp) TaxID=650164 RepID=K5WIF5_PHACS|nr:uncharacterized protein PHACADRAFT_136010 [Phanerochaete carnosa HHB-10118-sp]EKM58869.1 hypothetical protein PHACADRAFT_136010 [Phanerochaete carnosa HHB-10118-sp]